MYHELWKPFKVPRMKKREFSLKNLHRMLKKKIWSMFKSDALNSSETYKMKGMRTKRKNSKRLASFQEAI